MGRSGRPILNLPVRALTVRSTHPYVEKLRFKFYEQIHQPHTTTFLEHLATCQVWRGRQVRGHGVITFNKRQMPIQEFAYELYYSPIPHRDPLTHEVTKMVARCVAAGTPNCVHQNHLGLVPAGTQPCPPLSLELRQVVRRHFHEDGLDLMAPEPRGKMAKARVARIVLRIEGPDDPVLPCEQPVDNGG